MELRPFVGAIVGIVLAVYAPWALATWQGAFLAGAISGAAGAAATGGSILKGAFIGGFSGAAFFGVGQYFQGVSTANLNNEFSGALTKFGGNYLTGGQIAAQVLSHAAVGGVISVLQGGKFGNGFISAGITKGFTNLQLAAESVGDGLGAVTAGMIGGTVSAATGGKFANGFQTGAFQFLFNALVTQTTRWSFSKLEAAYQTKQKILDDPTKKFNEFEDEKIRDVEHGGSCGVRLSNAFNGIKGSETLKISLELS